MRKGVLFPSVSFQISFKMSIRLRFFKEQMCTEYTGFEFNTVERQQFRKERAYGTTVNRREMVNLPDLVQQHRDDSSRKSQKTPEKTSNDYSPTSLTSWLNYLLNTIEMMTTGQYESAVKWKLLTGWYYFNPNDLQTIWEMFNKLMSQTLNK